jgi:hypothetical protein
MPDAVQFKFDKEKLDAIKAFVAQDGRVKIGVLAAAVRKEKALNERLDKRIAKEGEARRKRYLYDMAGLHNKGSHKPIGNTKKRPIDAVALAAVHEFGSVKRGIPARSFLRQTMINKKKDFQAEIAKNITAMVNRISKGDGIGFLNRVGAIWVRYVHDTFEEMQSSWAQENPRYWAKKHTKKKLIETGAMLRSITHQVVK